MDKKKKILAIVIPVIVILLIALIIMLIVFLSKKNGESQGEPHTTHVYVYADESDTQHRKTCSGCSEVNVLEDHTFENEQATACTNCGHIRQVSTYPYSTPTGVKLSVDKTELTAGDEFTLTVEIETNRDAYWSSFDLIFSPLRASGSTDPTITAYFDFVSVTTSLDGLDDNQVRVTSAPRFTATQQMGYRILASFFEHISTSETNKISLQIVLKVKDNTPDISQFDFGVSHRAYNYVSYLKEVGQQSEADRADSDESITINKIQMTISHKEN